MPVVQEQQPKNPRLDIDHERLIQDIERRRMIMVLAFLAWNLICLSFVIMPVMQLLQLESHFPLLFGNLFFSFGVMAFFWRRHSPPPEPGAS